MEHILQFGITIDDEAIIAAVKAKAEKEIVEALKKEVENALFGMRYPYTSSPNHVFSNLAKEVFNDFLEEHKTEILNNASMLLAEKLVRSKAGKAILENIE